MKQRNDGQDEQKDKANDKDKKTGDQIQTNPDFEQSRGGESTIQPVSSEQTHDDYDIEDLDEDFYMDDDF